VSSLEDVPEQVDFVEISADILDVQAATVSTMVATAPLPLPKTHAADWIQSIGAQHIRNQHTWLLFRLHVPDPGAGAISLFIGTTRDNFEGKHVVRLEYEAYIPMALKEMRKICGLVRDQWSGVCVLFFFFF
jgi:hypothetical protein